MPQFIRIAGKSELPPPGEVREFDAAGKTICVANVDGAVHAMDNVCLHRGGPLGQGVVDNGMVVCPWHAWAWDPVTGRCAFNPEVRIAVFPLKVEGDDVMVEMQQ